MARVQQTYDFLSSQAPAKPTGFVLALGIRLFQNFHKMPPHHLHPGSLASRFFGLTPSERLQK